MPLAVPSSSSATVDKPYFDSLEELDLWAAAPAKKLDGVLRYCSRPPISEAGNRGKLLVCHDYKGGYAENPFAPSYTFNFWSCSDIFVYFSHHRVTVPPPGWITAAHRQGVKMLGTLIFEGSGEEDCLRLLVGRLPKSRTGHPTQPSSPSSLPLSRHYAQLLAELASQRGFDGYLLNIECPLQGGVEQSRALTSWITLLQSEIQAKVGPHGETIWYDSVVITGQLAWQDRLNNFNLPFFLSSSSIFTNYTWPNYYPNQTAQYFLSLDTAIAGGGSDTNTNFFPKSLKDIYMGVDVWGRGSHGDGGFGSYKAISHIDPESLGLSVALFGQAWTWESEQDKLGWTWEQWWEYERKLWVGPLSGSVDVPETPMKKGEPECTHGPFAPISSFFSRAPPPNPLDLAFHTTFCPGVGWAWFVNGAKVFHSVSGWTDIDKQCTVGDMVWPRPTLMWEDGERADGLPDCSSTLCMEDAWNAGSCLQLSLRYPGSDAEDAYFRCVWLPVQSLTITPQKSYEAIIVYKTESGPDLELDLGLSVKIPSTTAQSERPVQVTPNAVSNHELPGGWTKLCIQFLVPAESEGSDATVDVPAVIGLVVAVATEDPTQALQLSIFLGQLNVFSSLPSVQYPMLLWADFEPNPDESSTNHMSGTLTWGVGASFPSLTAINITSPEDPTPAWAAQASGSWFPSFLYFNIYAQCSSPNGNVGRPEDASWIGTTGLDGKISSFFVRQQSLSLTEGAEAKAVRFYVQGVTQYGEVLPWERCVFVDAAINTGDSDTSTIPLSLPSSG